MSKETKILIGVGGLAVIGLILALGGHMAVGLLILAVGLVAGFAGLRLTKENTDDPFAEARTEADRTSTGTLTPNEPLAPWSPEGGLTAWTPPAPAAPDPAPTADYAPPPEVAPPVEVAPEPALAEPSDWDDSSWDSTVTWEAEDTPGAPVEPPAAVPARPAPLESNPLDDLAGLDALDPIAEVERIESRAADPELAGTEDDSFSGFTTFDSPGSNGAAVPFVNENVSGADDIMAASQATELDSSVAGEQTELQKLLAKVQIRLSAYE